MRKNNIILNTKESIDLLAVIIVDCQIEPKIKIYHPDGSYFYREIGFLSKITE